MTPAPLPRRLPVLVAAGFFVCALAIAAVTVAPDRSAAGADDVSTIDSLRVLVPDEGLDPRILEMELTGATWRAATDRLDRALFARAENDRALASATRLLEQIAAEQDEATATRTGLQRDVEELAAELEQVEAILRARALQRYVHFGDDPLVGLEDPSVATDEGRSEELARRVDEVQFSTRAELTAARDSHAGRLSALDLRLLELGLADASTRSRQAATVARQTTVSDEVDAAVAGVRRARRSARVPGFDFPVVALDAYLDAESLLATNWPSCRVRWWMIAGVARIESRHGQIGGRSLQAGGRSSRPIIGIALDGGPGVRAMSDTDGGRLDGDDVWDRAVGPLQFIPETWSRRGRDGSGDGVADPQNLYDAAYSAGRYLCAIGGDLGSRTNLRAAYFGYNNSSDYVDDVIGWADRYSTLQLPAVADPVENAD